MHKLRLFLLFLLFHLTVFSQDAMQKDSIKVIFQNEISFYYNSDSILVEISSNGIDSLFSLIKSHSDYQCYLYVHTGLRGDYQHNFNLSQKRADKLKAALLEKLDSSYIIVAVGKGESENLYTYEEVKEQYSCDGVLINKSVKPKSNRRIEVILYK